MSVCRRGLRRVRGREAGLQIWPVRRVAAGILVPPRDISGAALRGWVTQRRVQVAGGACGSSRSARGRATPPFWGRRNAPARRSAEDCEVEPTPCATEVGRPAADPFPRKHFPLVARCAAACALTAGAAKTESLASLSPLKRSQKGCQSLGGRLWRKSFLSGTWPLQ